MVISKSRENIPIAFIIFLYLPYKFFDLGIASTTKKQTLLMTIKCESCHGTTLLPVVRTEFGAKTNSDRKNFSSGFDLRVGRHQKMKVLLSRDFNI